MPPFDALLRHKIVAIVRGIPADAADRTAEALARGGIRLLEVTMNTPGALDILARWRAAHAGTLHVGAGTVLDRTMAEAALDAGAEFLISPNVEEAVIAAGRERGVDVWSGATTATEVVRAWKAGATAIKLFPMGALGLRYFQEVRTPLDSIPMIAVGGIGLDNLREFLDAGACAVGVGGQLLDPKAIAAGRFDEIAATTARFVAEAAG